MSWQSLGPLLVTTLTALLGWYVAHYFASRRDAAVKQKDLRSKHLLDSFRRLSRVWCTLEQARNEGVPEITPDLEQELISDLVSTIRDIQLLGSITQLKKVANFLHELPEGKADFPEFLSALLKDLRSDLREGLGMPQGRTDIPWFYISHLGIKRPDGEQPAATD